MKVKVRDLIKGYSDESDNEGAVVGFDGKLNIRPAYQREFVYPDKRAIAVIETILDGCPLNNMYWAKSDDGMYEVVDGQQRTISIAHYVVDRNYSVEVDGKIKFFDNLSQEIKDKILDYELNVYLIEGTNDEKLKWFNKINISGMELTKQELRNSVYTGAWLSDAKKFFSKTKCNASKIAYGYWKMKDGWNRQRGLEIALSWAADNEGYGSDDVGIEKYMAKHQHDKDASELINFFKTVMDWVKKTFPITYKEMETIYPNDWYEMYKNHHNEVLDPIKLNDEVKRLLDDDDVEKKQGIWPYVLDHNEYHLHIRAFSDKIKNAVYREQKGICAITGKWYPIEEMHADHIIPWSKGGATVKENCQMIHKKANLVKSDK